MTSLVHHARRFRDLASMVPHSMIALPARGPGAISLDVLLARQFDRNGAAMRAGV
jgi:hypothetical protein